MKIKYILIALLGILTASLSSCGDDRELNDPDDMVVLNMKNVDNGKTPLGNTDIFLDADNNFNTSAYYFCDMGQVLSLGHIEIPDLLTITDKAAASPNEGYLAFPRENLYRFPSGHLAELISTDYYRFLVDSWIKESKKIVGAVVHFAQYFPEQYKLPAPGTAVGVINRSGGENECTFNLEQKNCEVVLDKACDSLLTCEVVTTKPLVARIYVNPYITAGENLVGRYKIYIRYKESYTTAYLYIK